ncbi:MAG: peptidoglycan-binding domain-containing protein [Verrucomicrobiia bacterium]
MVSPSYRRYRGFGLGAGIGFPLYGGSTIYRTAPPLVGPPPAYDYVPYQVIPPRGYIYEAGPSESYRSTPPPAYGPPLPPPPPRGQDSYWGVPLVAIQVQLARRGLYTGPIDGVFGSGTRRAVEMYQYQNGLPVTGIIDQRLLSSLGML